MTQTIASSTLSRRHLLAGLGAGAALALAGCTTTNRASIADATPSRGNIPPEYAAAYGVINDGEFTIPAIDLNRMDPQFLRREVAYNGPEAPGTIIIDTPSRFAYLVQPGGTAMRYGVGIGRQGFSWDGRARVQYKRRWPRWTPPSEMIARQPELEVYRTGMEPGLTNPLGARALYLFQDGRDTLYRLHGTPEWWTIGKAVSSGCVRFMNHDIIDLYDRAQDGATVIVNQASGGVTV
ncbi:L,D-transpeptidase [Aureimonas frigidaquae]|uniref:L,D-transpeptidase n=1 Tax=Aureimonas frigidaquae TaxID=424757 RepID=UPI000AECD92E|nr:L,D-transpeptidase [Aureimonas frigidaquae]